MPNNKEGVPQPSMINSKKYVENYDEIDFRPRNSYCCECGASIKQEDLESRPDLYLKYEDGHIAHKIGCNFN